MSAHQQERHASVVQVAPDLVLPEIARRELLVRPDIDLVVALQRPQMHPELIEPRLVVVAVADEHARALHGRPGVLFHPARARRHAQVEREPRVLEEQPPVVFVVQDVLFVVGAALGHLGDQVLVDEAPDPALRAG